MKVLKVPEVELTNSMVRPTTRQHIEKQIPQFGYNVIWHWVSAEAIMHNSNRLLSFFFACFGSRSTGAW